MKEYNFCNNCGRHGHLFHQCKNPITSMGMIVFNNNGNEIVVDVADYNKSLPVSWKQLLKKAKINYFAEKGIYDCVKMKSKEACEPVWVTRSVCIIVRS